MALAINAKMRNEIIYFALCVYAHHFVKSKLWQNWGDFTLLLETVRENTRVHTKTNFLFGISTSFVYMITTNVRRLVFTVRFNICCEMVTPWLLYCTSMMTWSSWRRPLFQETVVNDVYILSARPVARGVGPVGRPPKCGQVRFLRSTFFPVSEWIH